MTASDLSTFRGRARRRLVPLPAAGLVAAIVVSGVVLAQPPAPFRTSVDLVELYVSAVDAAGGPVTSLGRDDFEVFEDGRRQQVSVFTSGRIPLALAIALDRSFSVAGARLAVTKTAVEQLLDSLLPDDRVLLLAIGSRVDVVAPLGSRRAEQIQALRSIDAFGSTSLYDAILVAIDRIQEGAGRRALIVVSDGVDRYSQTTASEMTAHAKTQDVLVFPVVVGRTDSSALRELAEVTGGRFSSVREPAQLSATLDAIAADLRAQYLIGYTPAHRPTGERVWRSVKVSVKRSGVSVRTRQGYWTQ